jgi:hypothetical protein
MPTFSVLLPPFPGSLSKKENTTAAELLFLRTSRARLQDAYSIYRLVDDFRGVITYAREGDDCDGFGMGGPNHFRCGSGGWNRFSLVGSLSPDPGEQTDCDPQKAYIFSRISSVVDRVGHSPKERNLR